jgi:hypothetical protein
MLPLAAGFNPELSSYTRSDGSNDLSAHGARLDF